MLICASKIEINQTKQNPKPQTGLLSEEAAKSASDGNAGTAVSAFGVTPLPKYREEKL